MKKNLSWFSFGVCLFGLIHVLGGCSSAPPLVQVSPQEMATRDQAIGIEIARGFESHLTLKKDPAVATYLKSLATRLVEAMPEMGSLPIEVCLVQNIHDQTAEKAEWKTYALPGNRIYFPISLLRQTHFENEIAANLAIQLSHLAQKHVLERIIQLENENADFLFSSAFNHDWVMGVTPKLDYFGVNSIFAFSEKSEISAVEMAVRILYRVGFDPRGVISLFQRFQNNLEDSPYEPSTITKMIEKARLEIASQTPLRNPIIRSQAFIRIQKRIQEL